MQLKIAIAFVVAIALWGAFMIHRHYKKEKAAEAHAEEVYSLMTQSALKSPMAGLTFMGMALDKYHQDHQKFPDRITDLFPDYIKDQGFIRAVNWQYASGKDNFSLQKTISADGRQQTAYMDKSLRPRMKSESVQVAATPGQPQTASSPVEEADIVQPPVPLAAVSTGPARRLSPEELEEERRRLLDEMLTAAKTRTRYNIEDLEEEPELYDSFFTVYGRASEVRPDIGNRYLVWKNKDGSIGYGNVLYPDLQQSLVYQDGQWISSTFSGVDLLPEEEPIQKTGSGGSITERFGKEYLAWRDKSGAPGFGNMSYPTRRSQSVWLEGGWLEDDRGAVGREGRQAPFFSGSTPPSPDMTGRYGRQYLTWKDKSGALGFGDVHYPIARSQAVWQGGAWREVDPEAAGMTSLAKGVGFPSIERQDLLKQHRHSFLTWKDKDGVLGFSNVIYPAQKDIEIIMPDGTWRTITDNDNPEGPHAAE